jgi:hypothetical protein
VKTFRILVVLLLALLLPLRGAVAATMLCATPGEASEVTAAQHEDEHGRHAGHHDPAMHADHQAMAADPAPSHHDGQGAHADACNLCTSGCHATPLATAPPQLAQPRLTARLVFPALCVPAPAFQSDGQERPPRSI